MTFKQKKIECKERDFIITSFFIDPINKDQDRQYVQSIVDEVKHLETTQLNTSGKQRTLKELHNTKYLGMLAENVFQRYLKLKLPNNIEVNRDEYTNYEEHVDLSITNSNHNNNESLSVEIRCSFPYAKLERVICEIFQAIGPYTTSYKSKETFKDIYLTGLINKDVQKFDYNKPHELLFVGGAPKELFQKKGRKDNLKSTATYLVLPIVEILDVDQTLKYLNEKISSFSA